jgi:hypothetical protein
MIHKFHLPNLWMRRSGALITDAVASALQAGAFPWLSVCLGYLLCHDQLLQGGTLPRIEINPAGNGFVKSGSVETFSIRGFNYDHDRNGHLLEDYWEAEWETVVEDFKEMADLGANVVRIHLQFGKFMKGPRKSSPEPLKRLKKLLDLAEVTGLYLDLTGLGCYHKEDIPGWYDALGESDRWDAQAIFWESVSSACAGSTAVFCYDLMNEPILSGKGKVETDWLAGELGGKYFVQRLTLDLMVRSREEVVDQWVDKMCRAIRRHDSDALITVGVIPWAHVFPSAKPLFYRKKTFEHLDFVSVHFYPEKEGVEKAMKALKVYELGKPLVVEECFPLKCSFEEMDQFMTEADVFVDGWISFYWGKTISEYQKADTIPDHIVGGWLERLTAKWDKAGSLRR